MAFLSEKLISASGGVQEEAVDDDFNLVTGLYHFNGSNGAQNNTFLDSSDSGHSLTRNGNLTQGTFSPFSADDGKWSVNGASGASWVDVTNTSGDFQWGTGAFTIEGFVFITTDTFGPYLYGERPTGTNGRYVSLAFDSNGKIGWSGDGTWQILSASDVKTDRIGKWTHFAYVRNSTATNQTFIYWNGTLAATGTINVDYDLATRARLGGLDYVDASNNYGCLFSNYRLIKGTALYSGSTITVPTAPLTNITNTKLLTLQSNRFVDNSNNSNNSFTGNGGTTSIQPFSPFAPSSSYSSATKGGSGYFDGDGDYLRLPTSNDFDFSGSFTIEAWIYVTDTSDSRTVLGTCGNIGGRNGIYFGTSGTNFIFFQYITNSTLISAPMTTGQWNHVAGVRNGSVITLYINGTSVGSSTFSNSFSGDSAQGGVGGFYTNPQTAYFLGYMSDLRVVNGTAVYTSNFTPPTAPLTAITNTKLLLNYTNAAMFDQSGKTNVETVDNAQLDTSVKKFGSASAEFDGSGDILTMPQSTFIPFASEDWTVECFVRMNSVSGGYQCIFHASNGLQFMVYQDQLFLNINDTDDSSGYLIQAWGTDGQIAAADTWYHVAAYRVGSAFYTSVNGSVSSMGSSSGVIANPVQFPCEISWVYYPFDGYIDEFRITRKARYGSSNFTPPIKSLPNL